MTNPTSQQFESYLPVYDYMPDKWEEARRPLLEHLKKISNAVNIREIGWFLDQEVLSGQQFFPGTTTNNQEFRSILRVVVDFGAIVVGPNVRAHNVLVDANFSLIDLWGAATDAALLTGTPINQPNITYDATNITITATAAFTRAFAFMEYIQEL